MDFVGSPILKTSTDNEIHDLFNALMYRNHIHEIKFLKNCKISTIHDH